MTATPETTIDTAARLADIRGREEAATPGPWGADYNGAGTYDIHSRPRVSLPEGMTSDGVVAALKGKHGDQQIYANARFTAYARADVPFLLALVTELAGLVQGMADPDPCWFDHQGYCRAHGWMAVEPKCPHGRAQALFPEIRES